MKEVAEGIFLKDSGKKGNITTIMVGVHGDEYSGIEALEEILNNLNINKGKVYFIYANLRAIEQNVRFTEKNLNRCFLKTNIGNSYEERRAVDILKYLDKSDFLLDIHNTISFNSSLEILITTNIEYSKYFNIKKVVSNIDDIQKGGSDGYMDSIGKKGFCLECGSIYFGDREKSKRLAQESIINFLKVTGNIFGIPKEYNGIELIIKMKLMYKVKTNNFRLIKEFKDFEFIKAGEVIGYDGEEEIKVKNDSYILFAQIKETIGNEAFCLGEK